ncbi:putative regulatory protein, involved in type III secretion lcrH, sycD [Chlamydiales bacterium STE3]|nr:putative regulatory protein, involved in type III secretion lcrH, sycD [Chlamydiales bacterium STE3]
MKKDDLNEFKLSKKAKARLKNKPLLKKWLAEGKTAQQILDFSESAMLKFYQAAYHLLEHNRHEDAANAFIFLVTLNPYHHDYWIGLGMASQLRHDYEMAIDAYEMAAVCRVEDPTPYFYLAKCLFAIHDRASALLAFDLAIEYAGENEKFKDLKKQALQAKKILLKST